ncbi:MAG: ATP-binding cassette domain-containing protein [Firmicutes bacterium]|nr:ATP-binding cassette domain-containing protein [Bacillota bacterium]
MLKLENVKWTAEDGSEILKGIDFEAKEGTLTVITGPNGSGKTTLAKVISGVEKLACGSIKLGETELAGLDITQRAKRGVAYAFQQPVRFKGITVRDLIELADGGKVEEMDVCRVMNKVGLCTQDYIDREVNDSLSGGEIKRIEIATVLARKDAKLLVFDEPEAGIDLWSFNGLVDAFEELKREKDKVLLVISHQERLLEIADQIVVIDGGTVRVAGPGKEVLPQLMQGEVVGDCPVGKERA